MRIMVTIDGRVSVHEILEFEPQEDGTVLLTTHEDTVDLIVHGMNKFRMEAVMNELLKLGYSNISEYETTYDETCLDCDDDDEYDADICSAVCPECHRPFVFHLPENAKTMNNIICPHCYEELEFELCDEPVLEVIPASNKSDDNDGDDELVFEAECSKCGVSVGAFQRDVKNGYVTCPFCKSTLHFDVIDAENGTFEDCDGEDEDE